MTGHFGQYLKDHWFIFAAIVAMATAWGTNTTQLAFAQDKVSENAEAIKAVKQDIGEINKSIAAIEANQANAKEDVTEIKALLREVSRKIDSNRE